ncbi:MAG: hypothetical protein QNJ32_10945 [Xenococcaceae cyanobacterium MO_167.B27]|nr:hypothetical protein [Xenococcaceae cyanobacterium MO_167.B27]
MSDEGIIQFTFGLDEPELEDEQRLKFGKKLLRELRNLDEVEKVDRTEDLTPEAGSKPGFATLIGSITALVHVKDIKAFLGFLGDRLQDKPIKGSIKVGDNKIEFEVKSRQELAEFEKTALNLIAAMSGESNVKEGSSTDRG